MRHFSKLTLLIPAVAVAALMGCDTPTINTYTVVQGKGSLAGRVTTLDWASPSITPSTAGVKVWLEGTQLSTLSDSNAFYRIDSIPAGSYTLKFWEPGADTTFYFGVSIPGPGVTAHGGGIVLIPNERVVLSPSSPSPLYPNAVRVQWKPLTQWTRSQLQFALAIGADSSVIASTPRVAVPGRALILIGKESPDSVADIMAYTMRDNGLTKGTMQFMRICVLNRGETTADPITQEIHLPTDGPWSYAEPITIP